MAENINYMAKTHEQGCIRISEEVVASIAALAVAEIEGVESLASSSALDFSDILGKKSIVRGVKIQLFEESVTVDIYLCVKFGFVIPDVAKKIQDTVSSTIESMAGLAVEKVNVHVTGVGFPKPKNTK